MIYKATWDDGREAIVRASDEEAARLLVTSWRETDPMFDRNLGASTTPISIAHVPSRGPVAVLVFGWENT